MTILWAIVLIVYGLVCGWDKIHTLYWFLLLPFLLLDGYIAGEKKGAKDYAADSSTQEDEYGDLDRPQPPTGPSQNVTFSE